MIAKYRSDGACALQSEYSDLFRSACNDDSSANLKSFVIDVALDLKHWKDAIEMLNALQRQGQLTSVHYNLLAYARWELDDEIGAIDAYQKSLALDSSNVSSLRGVCILLNQHDRDAEAKSFAQKWLELAPADPEAVEYGRTVLENCEKQ